MKAIINEKLYDTETADELYEFRRKYPSVCVNGIQLYGFHDVILYKTKKGAYFEYDKLDKEITTTTKESAKDIVKHCSPDAYMEIWGVKVEDA